MIALLLIILVYKAALSLRYRTGVNSGYTGSYLDIPPRIYELPLILISFPTNPHTPARTDPRFLVEKTLLQTEPTIFPLRNQACFVLITFETIRENQCRLLNHKAQDL